MASSPSTTTTRIVATLEREALEILTVSRDAVLSGGWWYPLQGVWYLLSHASLYRAIFPVILKILLTALGITAALFTFTYLPQVAFCALFSGPFAFATAALLVLGEAYAVIMFVSKAFFLGRAQDQLFNAVFRQQGINLVYVEQKGKSRSFAQTLFKGVSKPLQRFSREGLLRYVVSLPLNLVPMVGTVLFLLYNGAKAGPTFHARYFQAKGMTPAARQVFVDKRKGAYTAFGAATLGLNLVPVVGPVFMLSSTVGAALWACELEKKEKDRESSLSGKRVVVAAE
ncbi:hypothetical protein DFH08DRAFT_865189 [Mycena albidolilacea]|uniref:Outer spore wall protein RRT8 n=1 Tax=Mycena albidolilacea TaxID=1033008 RepID=A0AAD7EUI7_9AGAR|nr:hypothetical protein DFH08DRAFT_865189 [Mycena albidolilacea]